MTEYDYSPDAYERFLANQDRVSRWVNKQSHHAREYSSPFIDPSVIGDTHSRSGSGFRERDRGSSRHGSASPPSLSRPPPKRSQTTPVPVIAPSHVVYQQSQPRVVSPTSPYRPTHHQSYSTHNVNHNQPQHPTPQVAYISSGSGYKSGVTTKTYTMDPHSGELYLPPPRRGEQYIIIPPKGRTVQVFHEYSDGSRSSATSRSSSRSPRSPTKKDEPLLKRLFHLGAGGGQKIKSGGSSSRRQRRLSF